MEMYPVQKECVVETLKLIDLDRLILDTELFHVLMREAAFEEAGISVAELNGLKDRKEAAGETFHTDEMILDVLSERYLAALINGVMPDKTPDEQLNAIFAWMLELCEDPNIQDALFLPGAKKFVNDLEISGAFERGEACFMTWGTEPLQMLKLMCLGLNKHPYNITKERDKGEYIARSRNEDDKYVFVTMNGLQITATNVELYDDKASSFKGLPTRKERVRGFLKRPEGQKALRSQKGETPENVKRIRKFPDVLHLGRAALKHKNNIDK